MILIKLLKSKRYEPALLIDTPHVVRSDTASTSRGRGNADGKDVTWSNTHLKAGEQILLSSGGDTTLKGAVVQAPRIDAQVGGNLLIQSLQDTSTYTSQQKSSGGSITVGTAGVSGSVNAGKSNINSQYTSVTEQSGLRAGDGGFNVNVQGNTRLVGGAITSTQAAIDHGKNTFQTAGQSAQQALASGTLTVTDLHNQASYSASSSSVNLGTGFSPQGKLTPQGTGAGWGKDSGQASSVTQSAISGMAGNTAARTGDAETGINKIFDADRVQKEINAQTQITQLFGQQAPKAAAEFAQNQSERLKEQARQADKAGNTEEAQRLKAEAKAWDEGGAYRVALHTTIGALSGGSSGAAGGFASASTAPLLNAFQDQLTQNLKDAGANDKVAQSAGQLIASLTVAGIGAAASGGSVAGAAVAFNIDANNRQLHPTEAQRIKQLAQGDKQKEARLTAAACAMIRCADGIPTDDPNYAYLKALQDSGAGLKTEQALLSQQTGQVGRTLNQQLFQYTPGQDLQDSLSANKVGTRTLGAAQGVAGVAGVIGSGALCTSGLGCAVGAITGTASFDYAWAGVKQAATGNTQTPYGEQVLQSLGLSPEAAAWTYAALGLAPAGVEAVAASKAVNLNTAANAWARGTYTGQSAITHEGRVYRFSDPKYANTTWEIYPGNVSTDMRYSGPGVGSIYSGTSVQTAAAEVMSYRDLSIGVFKPKSLVAGDVRIDNVLDLTDPAALKALGVTKDQITKSSHGVNGAYTHTQRIAEWAREQGYNGILAPSAQNKSGTNLITFDNTVVTNVRVSPQPPVPPRFGRGTP